MPKVTVPFPSLTGGVSQQPGPIRLPSQGSVQTNAISLAVEGMKKRGPLEHKGKLTSALTGAALHHLIDRDDTEKYNLIAQSSKLQAFDVLTPGTKEDIVDSTGVAYDDDDAAFAYLTTSDPENDIVALTVADYTILVNRAIKPVMDTAVTANPNPRGLAYARQGNYSTKYRIDIKKGASSWWVVYETHSSNGKQPNEGSGSVHDAEKSIRTSGIAAALRHGLNESVISSFFTDKGSLTRGGNGAFPMTGVSASSYDHILHFQSTDSTDFDILTKNDEAGSANLITCKDSVQLFSDLPTSGIDNFKIEIKGNPGNDDAAYWVLFTVRDFDPQAAQFGEGSWSETNAPNIEYKFDVTTMPHLLIRLSNGDFFYTPADGQNGSHDVLVPTWGERNVGDEETNPKPSFIDDVKGIRSLFFWQNRLGLLVRDAVVLSETGELFNFFKTTVTDLLDTARIDASTQTQKVDDLEHAVPISEKLTLFGTKAQHIMRGGATLTPTSVSIAPASHYESMRGVQPTVLGEALLAPDMRGSSGIIRELRILGQEEAELRGIELTAGIPTYIAGTISRLEASTSESMVAVVESTNQNTIYIYTFFINGGERVQSAWQKFVFDGDTTIIRGMTFVKSDLYLIMERGSEMSVELIQMGPFISDTGSDYIFALDRRIDETGLSSNTYAAGPDETTLTLPYAIPAGVTMNVYKKSGVKIPIKSETSVTLVLTGDFTADNLWIGEQYESVYEFSKPHLQTRDGQPIASSVLRMGMANLLYEDSGYFKVEVTPDVGVTSESTFTGITLSAGVPLDGVKLQSGRHRFAVMGLAKDITVTVKNNSPFPSKFIAIDWECSYRNIGGKRVG